MLCNQNTQQAEVGIDRKGQSKDISKKEFDQTL